MQKHYDYCGDEGEEHMRIHTDYYISGYKPDYEDDVCRYAEMYRSVAELYPNLLDGMKVSRIKYDVSIIDIPNHSPIIEDIRAQNSLIEERLLSMDSLIKAKIDTTDALDEWCDKYSGSVTYYKGVMDIRLTHKPLLELSAGGYSTSTRR